MHDSKSEEFLSTRTGIYRAGRKRNIADQSNSIHSVKKQQERIANTNELCVGISKTS